MVALFRKTDHKTLAVWAMAYVERVLPYLKGIYPADQRPRGALEILQAWIDTEVFMMAVIRQATIAS